MDDCRLASFLADTAPWNNEPGAIWIASVLSLRRNLTSYNFPSKMGEMDRNQVEKRIKNSLEAFPDLHHLHFFAFKDLNQQEKHLLYERCLFLQGFTELPSCSGILVDKKGGVLVLINFDNHLELRFIESTGSWGEHWNLLAQLDHHLEKGLNFAFSPKFGYLTADPAQCGTGLILSVYLHVPGLIHTHQLEAVLSSLDDSEVEVMGLAGNLTEMTGDQLVVQNAYTIGMNEESIFHSVQKGANKLIYAEKGVRAHLKEKLNPEIRDQVSKAFGLILHAHKLDAKEALDLLSTMKLGLALNLIGNVEEAKLNRLFFDCRIGTLSEEMQDEGEIGEKRADFLQKALKGMSCVD